MRALSRVVGGLIAFQAAVTTAWACSCIVTTPEEAIASGDLIVVATVTEVRRPGCGCDGVYSSMDQVRVTVDVTEVIAGDAELGSLEVSTNAEGASCGLDLHEGETWVLQVSGDEDFVSLCTAAKKLDGDSDPWLQALRDAAAQ